MFQVSLKATEKETKIAFLFPVRGTLKNKLTAWGHTGEHTNEKILPNLSLRSSLGAHIILDARVNLPRAAAG